MVGKVLRGKKESVETKGKVEWAMQKPERGAWNGEKEGKAKAS